MKKLTSFTKNKYFPFYAAILAGLLIWLIDAFVDTLYFNEGTLLEILITNVPSHELYMRGLVMAAFAAFGYVASIVFNSRLADKEAFIESEQKYRLLAENVNDVIWTMDMDLNYTYVSPSVKQMRGYEVEEVMQQSVTDVLTPDSIKVMGEVLAAELAIEQRDDKDLNRYNKLDLEMICKDGSTVWTDVHVSFIRNDAGEATGLLGVTRDIHEKIEAQNALKESEEKYRLLIDNAAEGIVVIQNGVLVLTNPHAMDIVGLTGADVENLTEELFFDFVHPDDREFAAGVYLKRLAGEDVPGPDHMRLVRKDGHIIWAAISPVMITWESEPAILAFITDITDRLEAENALKQSEEKFRVFTESIPSAILIFQGQECKYINPAGIELIGYTAEEMSALPPQGYLHPDFREIGVKSQKMIEDGEIEFEINEGLIINKDGKEKWVEGGFQAVEYEGRPAALGFAFDITSRKIAEEALKESEELFRIAFHTSPDSININSLEDGVYIATNEGFTTMSGFTAEESIGRTSLEIDVWQDPKDRAEMVANLRKYGFVKNKEYQFKNKEDQTVIGLLSANLISMDNKDRIISVIRDITDLKNAELEKQKLENQLHQAQKMEAIGTLAGGIAHDFNNLLMGIQGRTSLMLAGENLSPAQSDHLRSMQEYVHSAADLTKQLLGFARGGKYQVVPIDLTNLIARQNRIFGRTMKEVTIKEKFQKPVWTVEADQGQIEQIILNLYVNASQAMPNGGEIIVEVANEQFDDERADQSPFEILPGNYVRITVSDTGVGMDEETKQRIFEPFFTTKEMGRGTGLGLASAYGIIKNHHGFVEVTTEKNKGTTFNIYLPASDKAEPKKVAADDGVLPGSGTILLVDDENIVIEVGSQMLESLGYDVLVARNGAQAIEIYDSNKDEIDLVILDMIMPVMSGGETYDRLTSLNADIKVLLASGYSLNGRAREILDRGCKGFIQKPFNVEKLSHEVKEAIHS